MKNRQLTKNEINNLFLPLYKTVTLRLQKSSLGNAKLLWALRRKLVKSLSYDERGTPMHRRRIKAMKRAEQNNKCAICHKSLPKRDVVLDRFEAMKGYTLKNTRVLCRKCDFGVQAERKFK